MKRRKRRAPFWAALALWGIWLPFWLRGFLACPGWTGEHDDGAMRKRRVILGGLLLAVAGVVGMLVVVLIPARQANVRLILSGPSYAGKRLSEWVAGYSPTPMSDSDQRPTTEATNAIREIGSNAIPYLLEWIRYEGPYDPSESEIHKDPARQRASGAAAAFGVLGPVAEEAIPELVRILNDPKAHDSAARAAFALGGLGEDGLAPLLAVLTNQRAGDLRIFAAASIRNMGTNARPAVPVLIRYFEDTNHGVAGNVLATLHNQKPLPVEIIPALVKSLGNGRTEVTHSAMILLARYGVEARSAVPSLLRLLGDADFGTRKAATNALRDIDPKALEQGIGR